MDTLGTSIYCSEVVPSLEVEYREGANSLSIEGRLSTLQSVHYRRFHCITILRDTHLHSSKESV